MSNDAIIWIVVIIAAVVVGSIIGIVLGIRKNRKISGESSVSVQTNKKSWEVLLQHQICVDVLTVPEILKWAKTCQHSAKDGDNLFLFKATKNNIEKLQYTYPAQIDSDTNIVACCINTKTGNMAHTQLYTFGSVSPQVDELFAGDDYAVITL